MGESVMVTTAIT